jgi:signal transduction histidine kinase
VEDRGETLVISRFRDVTERKRNEAELKRLASELEARVEQRTSQLSSMVRELESFSYTVSHDLRAPVRHMRGYSAALLSEFADQLPPEYVRMLDRIEASGERMDALITGLLDLSKVSRDALKLRRCDISAIAAAAIGTQRELDPARQVTVEIEPGLEVEADRGMLEALIGNLISNAWKFTANTASPHIAVGRASLWGKTVFYVRDNGAGFDMAGAHRLYEPFRRLHPVDEYPGTGIGLATVHRIVERHGGGIEVESAPGKGTTFYFSLGKAEEALALG